MSLLKKFPVQSIAVVSAIGIIAYKYGFLKFRDRRIIKYILVESIDDWNLQESEIEDVLEKCKVIGIDCEWVTVESKRKPVSLLQLATDSGFCVLVRLSCLPVWLIPPVLIDMLSNEEILKVGVGVAEDANKLFNDYGLEVHGFVDLRYLAKDLKEVQGKNMSLKSLGVELLGIDLNKSKELRCSDWNAPHLSEEQVEYAAADAIVAAKIFTMIQRRKSKWLFINNREFLKELDIYKDIPFKQVLVNNCKRNAGLSVLKKPHKSRYSKPRQKPMYDNCQLVAPDGELLCSCDKGKAEWYVYKGLGEKISDEPFTVRLNFEPSGRPKLDNVFYTMEKTNQCVVCGRTENFHRKLVVPSEYRRYFPNLMKKNLSHDVLLLCVQCHKKSNILDQEMRQNFAKLCDAPLGCQKNVKYKFNPKLSKVKSAAKALHISGGKMPECRQQELKKVICDYYCITSVTDDIINEARNLETSELNDAFVPHGLKVYQYFCENGGLIQFEKLWRQHFLDSMQPQYLPPMWSVEHNHKRLALQVINNERDVDFEESILGLTPELVEEIKELKP
ncbi:exonuclease 3'-5' domain-containing protein 2 [Trichonephila inaurata madagascariensis]|uniref:Exonuclease 3'-5' domain-containing protein 2 n=1 Tax=Trichonephila inaurata madagascariensis TaxID=2747483 RepID=A0A8X6YC42_9ARAC|nr:exonuclease 3'-5' domain-containing protein 2 [Trichonephila inaurata madagascariensis]